MCTFLIYFDPKSPQPLLMASTRDEALNRGTRLPSQVNWNVPQTYLTALDQPQSRLHLNFLEEPETPGVPPEIADYARKTNPLRYRRYVTAGIQAPQDTGTGGTFGGINKHGVVVAVNNLEMNINAKNKLARGGLALDALTFDSAEKAARALYQKLIEVQAHGLQRQGEIYHYPALNLIIADKDNAYVLQCAPTASLPMSMSPHTTPGQIEERPSPLGDVTVIGKTGGQSMYVSLQPIRPREPTILCGWGQNDERSLRTKHFLPRFQRLLQIFPLPSASHLPSWGPWISFMQNRTQHTGGAYARSIAQPPFQWPDRTLEGQEIFWGTISTSLFGISRYPSGKIVARMYYSPAMPEAKKTMEFQRIKSDSTIPLATTQPRPANIALLPPGNNNRREVILISSPPRKNSPETRRFSESEPHNTIDPANIQASRDSGWDIAASDR